MAAVSDVSLPEIKRDLLYAAKECSERGLVHSGKWAAELSCSLPPFASAEHLPKTEYVDSQFICEYDRYALGKAYFDLKEFDRAAVVLEGCSSQKAYFVHAYAKFLAGEKHKNDEFADVSGPQETTRNKNLSSLRADLCGKHEDLDGFCLYLYGLVLKKLDIKKEALDILLEAVNKEPLHWGAWLELASLCTSKDMLQSLQLPSHWMCEFFRAHVAIELQMIEEALERYTNLGNVGFAKSNYILLQTAMVHYHARDFYTAVELFKELQKQDPYGLDHMDTYSNILFVREMKPELSYLAHRTCEIDKYREETCCVIGNYYSLSGQHEKAATYFQRALKLNPQYTSAWTLMGHEFMEMKNTSAAIQCYRRAIEANFRDYRAWYGLGQTYEILKMPCYCLYYYRQAQKLRPNDSRMLVALGENYKKLNKLLEAKKCFFRAISVGDVEGIAVIKLAILHDELQEEDEAAKYYSRYAEQAETVGVVSVDDLCSAYPFLARFHLKKKNLEEAEKYAHKCCEHNESRESGKSLLRQIASARASEEPHRDCSFSHELSLGHMLTESGQAFLSPVDQVSPMNLNFKFNTP